ncbi:hypothetical protein RSOLAG22IIIB_13501 [Rhizoctonia solani]|uniref:Uncharacterized protein n=1 Tax=Rhizoctonia solani TaxID=456999 RepID=A0A0K6FNT1_9AGAM|nr:hypothetical protein RSOLAG22IIIB_13501 [Rhizoctonia solani]
MWGRPLLWGIFGSKIIEPFGIIGTWFSSDGFKHRLQEEYRRKPTEDNPDEIKITAFLRDFVLDLGPIDPTYDSIVESTEPSDTLPGALAGAGDSIPGVTNNARSVNISLVPLERRDSDGP